MSQNLLVVGSVAYDDVETPTAAKKDLLGGSATYSSIAASHFTRPQLVGVVGNDFKDSDRALLDSHGINLNGLETDSSGDTFRWGGKYHKNMNERSTLYTHLNVFEHFQPQIPDEYANSRYVFLGNIAPELQCQVLSQVRGTELVGLDTMNFWITGRREALAEALKQIDVLIVNDEEAELLTKESTLLVAAESLQTLGPRTVIIKRGEHGAFLFNDDDVFHVPAFPVATVCDPTGAGDSFAGGFMGWLSRTGDLSPENMRRAIVLASVTASFCVEGFGTQSLSNLSPDALKQRYRSFEKLTQCPELKL
ncbi:MAG TPA: sugar kinase [Myxococcales bacterium]|nr:sugar kinase [Myxococcales bacterium]